MKRALVTGHAGFVGRHLVAALLDRGYSVTGCDIADPVAARDARDLFRRDDTRFDLVAHLAAIVGGRATIEGQPMTVASDLAIDADMWQYVLRTRPGRVVYYSSSAAYPTSLQTRSYHRPLMETDINLDDIRSPDLTYGLVKLVGEIGAKHVAAEGIPVHVLRPFSGYGEDQALDYPFPSFIGRASRGDKPFKVWGDGTQVRDFVHIDDVVGATLAAVDNDVRQPVNIGTGRATSFNEFAAMCMAAAGYETPLLHVETAPTGVHYRVADPSLMLGFYTPRITLEEGIARALHTARAAA